MNADVVRPFAPAFVLALCAVLLGQGIGIAFGAAEETLKGSLKADAELVLATTYGGDAAKAKAVVDKSWVYYQRAHLHAGALGTFALVFALLLALIPGHLLLRRACAAGVSVGAFGYGSFWLWAGMRAPGLGSTGAAKESLTWLAWASSGLLVGGTLFGLALTAMALRRRADESVSS
ncbi:MAG: hypothetical protein Q8O67_30630 [Deltaproteobacteria bacterium]|nr:hypothetical protein [Deltaproteobacteria bacterium]